MKHNSHILSLVFLILTLLICNDCTLRPLLNDWVLRVDTGVYPAYIPSTVIDMLIKNNILPSDFYYRDNFLKAYEYQTKDATYTLNFFTSQAEVSAKYKFLVFQGLDTHCEVFLNDKKILQSHNMFRRYEISVELERLNNLTVKFYSPARYDLNEESMFKEKYGFVLPQNYSFSRKAAYHYGWDWGPRIASMGIYKQVYLSTYNETRFVDLHLKQLTQITNSTQLIRSLIHIQIDHLNITNHYSVQLSVTSSKTQSKVFDKKFQFSKLSHYEASVDWNITQDITSYIWWTWQLGDQPLFVLTAKLIDTQSKQQYTTSVSNIGFRTVKLNQSLTQGGKQFTINLNGLDIYARGGNYIPPQMSLTQTTPQTYIKVIRNARQQNFNMIRVWGGGHFEKDQFYTQCDQNGILIWHDLMFACALYPYSQDIGADIEQEMRDNLRRLRHHPSIALWNGNNEVWIGWQQWGWKNNKTQSQKQIIEDMYKGIFQNSLPKVINEITPQIPYWETSPSVSSNSLETINSGDIHFWRVWGAGTPIEEYSQFIGRFNSEYGMQSMPDISTIENFTAPDDRKLGSLVLRLHERHPKGDEYLPMYVSNNTHSSSNLTRFSYFSQVMQSYVLQLAITSLRGNKPYNMGSLYWQLNDVWPVSSWSTIDYLNVKKAAHYKISQLYQPLQVACYDSEPQSLGNYSIYVVNDYNKRFNCHFEIKTISFTGTVLNTTVAQRTVQLMSRALVMKMYTTVQEIAQLKTMYKNSFMRVEMNCVEKQSRSYDFFFTKMKNRTIIDPQLTYSYNNTQNTVTIHTKNLATYVWIYSYSESQDRHYAFKEIEDNYFTLLPGETRTINVGLHDISSFGTVSVTCYEIQTLKEIKIEKQKQFLQRLTVLKRKQVQQAEKLNPSEQISLQSVD